MSAAPEVPLEQRRRPRPKPIPLTEEQRTTQVPMRIREFYDQDDEARGVDIDLRRQRYAKLMQYTTEVEEPFEGASNVQLPDILSAVLRSEDTLQNAIMTTRPIANAKAVNEQNRERERNTDLLLDYQFFVEQPGEDLIEQMTMNFVRDGDFTALTRWVRDFRKILTLREFRPIPINIPPREHFLEILQEVYSAESDQYRELAESDGWDWMITRNGEEYLVRFFTDDDDTVLMQIEGFVECYTGPRICVYDYEDVLAPYWSLNLQPPSPSNPHGAPHVILVDYPTLDEIRRGIETGFYDLAEESDLDSFEADGDWTTTDREIERARRTVRGVREDEENSKEAPDHRQIQRLMVFDVWEGLDVVWTLLRGSKDLLLRARPLTEVSPGIPPRRPIAHASMIRVQGTWRGMGLPELMESMHDLMCEAFNSSRDASQFELYPFFKYREASTLTKEDIHLEPGGGIPCVDVDRDLKFERANSQAMAIGINQISLGQRFQEDLTLLGDLQAGRIPAGKSSALRTSGGIQQVLAQGEARPQRILRRFFTGVLDVHRDMYRLDQHFLPDRKKFRVIGLSEPGEDPFIEVQKSDCAECVFDFEANILNSSKVALQSGIQAAMGVLVNPLALQLGLTSPGSAYRIFSDFLRALGLNPAHYIQEPPPEQKLAPISAEEVVSMILQGVVPRGTPSEGDTQQHVQRIQEILSMPNDMGMAVGESLSDGQQELLGRWTEEIQRQAQEAQRRAQLLQAAQSFAAQQQQRSPNPGQAAESNPEQPALSGPSETLDESLPVGTGTPQ